MEVRATGHLPGTIMGHQRAKVMATLTAKVMVILPERVIAMITLTEEVLIPTAKVHIVTAGAAEEPGLPSPEVVVPVTRILRIREEITQAVLIIATGIVMGIVVDLISADTVMEDIAMEDTVMEDVAADTANLKCLGVVPLTCTFT